MNPYSHYSIETQLSGWTRIDMLLALYEKAIGGVMAARDASECGNHGLQAKKLIESNRLLLALHSGLNTDEYPLAVDIARLLNFVMLRLSEQNYTEAIHFLEKLKSSYEQIREEATALEKQGKFQGLNAPSGLNAIA